MKLAPELRSVAAALFSQLDTPVALSASLLMKYGEWDQLRNRWIDPRNYLDCPAGVERYRRDSQATNFLRKSPLLPGSNPKMRRLAAEATFEECETQCAITNSLLQSLDIRRYLASRSELEVRLVSILDKARKIATRILGRLPDDFNGRFGPGTSVELKGNVYSTYADKVTITPTTTTNNRALFEHDYWRTHWGRRRLELGLPLPGTSRGNRFSTVPKDATKDRGICVEPLGNLWTQLGLGGELKRRLSAVGLHVGVTALPDDPLVQLKSRRPFDGQQHHRDMARVGSMIPGSWATIDLSNASDTVSYELVKWVIPTDWFEWLNATRSPYTYLNKTWIRLEKFSSMGNGATFELESLVFAVLVAAASDLKVGEDVFSYGDDILLPEKHAPNAMAILKACGFTPNGRKSFTCGSFKESCGGDFFCGVDVRSCYADSDFTEPTDWIVLHNQLRKWGLRGPVLHRCVANVPKRLRIFGPTRMGDRLFHDSGKRYSIAFKDSIGYLPVIEVMPVKIPAERWGTEFFMTLGLLGTLRNHSSRVRPTLSPRGSINGYRICKASVS